MSDKPKWKLEDRTTGKEVQPGDKLKTFRDEEVTYVSGEPPHKDESTGRITVTDAKGTKWRYFPGVCGLAWRQG